MMPLLIAALLLTPHARAEDAAKPRSAVADARRSRRLCRRDSRWRSCESDRETFRLRSNN